MQGIFYGYQCFVHLLGPFEGRLCVQSFDSSAQATVNDNDWLYLAYLDSLSYYLAILDSVDVLANKVRRMSE